ncbi:hypothetical protein F2Q69_00002838 [Brassica cretica]|uniref:HMA domain-containing protein n=1 Tax=Brassica cretica TaxID=69181 RepID=A0A8S9PH20_BRACR|nr:hypothetical protein F2Q69_00002838 [Brassica cretica]
MGTLLGDLSMVTKLTSMWKERLSEWSVGSGSLRETAPQEYEEAASMAVFRIVGMTCSACAGSVERAIKRLPGIHEVVVDALNNRAQILFYPGVVNVSFSFFFGQRQ